LSNLKEQRSGRPKTSDHEDAYQFLGQVAELVPQDDHGFLLNKEGSLLYFHRNSVLGNFDALRRGQEVHYVEEVGDTGPLAKKVRPVGAG
jgi:cold shock CspA family protein